MHAWIRVDAALWMGNGHVTRCLTLARALAASGGVCHFVCRAYPGNLIALIRQAGFPVHELPDDGAEVAASEADFSEWLRDSVARDAALTRRIIGEHAVDWLIVDHYALGASWERSLEAAGARCMVIDDLANRSHVCQLLLDQTLGRSDEAYRNLVPADTTLLCGAGYALLRPEFSSLRLKSLARRRTDSGVRRLLVSMGGVDNPNVTRRVIDVLSTMSLPAGFEVIVVLGQNAPWRSHVQEQLATLGMRASLEVGVEDMAALMATCDVAIGAAGSSAWERCCLGMPSVIVVLAENQREVAASLSQAGAAAVIDEISQLPVRLPALLRPLLEDADVYAQMSASAASVTDGKGASQVANWLWRCM